MYDVTQPIHVGVLNRVGVEEVVGSEVHPLLCDGVWVLFWPDNRFCLLQYWCPVLDDELQLWMKVRELQTESA
jgi:hypothetical protein